MLYNKQSILFHYDMVGFVFHTQYNVGTHGVNSNILLLDIQSPQHPMFYTYILNSIVIYSPRSMSMTGT